MKIASVTADQALREMAFARARKQTPSDLLVDCASEKERDAVTREGYELLRRGLVQRVIVDTRASTWQVAIIFREQRCA
jgi:hypothetical protein